MMDQKEKVLYNWAMYIGYWSRESENWTEKDFEELGFTCLNGKPVKPEWKITPLGEIRVS